MTRADLPDLMREAARLGCALQLRTAFPVIVGDRAILFAGRSRSTHALGVGGTLHDLLINANVPIVVLL